ncbi:MAG: uracil-DNA glycosylase [Candidatus Pacebacteria bacterium]|nr:uracil-DNA glycosylase [Candidatus Paceibacterota bacterium]
MTSKRDRLNELNKYWQNNCKCSLKETATQAVFGDGNPSAQIVFIGEAPGKNEDSLGKPFVGAAGKFLDKMLEEIGMKREDVYITNIVKYRPPDNRDPLPEEKDSCNEWLINELKIISPLLIVFLGRHSMLRFFPEGKISGLHGKLLIKKIPELDKKQSFMPLYHPAAALYNGGMRETLIKDFKKIIKALEKINIA